MTFKHEPSGYYIIADSRQKARSLLWKSVRIGSKSTELKIVEKVPHESISKVLIRDRDFS